MYKKLKTRKIFLKAAHNTNKFRRVSPKYEFENICATPTLTLQIRNLWMSQENQDHRNINYFTLDHNLLHFSFIIHSLVFCFRGRAGRNQSRHVTGMALAHCILGKFLGVVCHCFPPPLDVPTFAARCLYVRSYTFILFYYFFNMTNVFLKNILK